MSKKTETAKPAGKPREVVPAPSSAGAEEAQDRARRIRGLPFDPAEYTADSELPAKLEEITSVRTLNDLQALDTRTTAAAHYERRIKAIVAGQSASAEQE